MILNVDPEKTEEWDKAIREADEKFAQEEHNLIKYYISLIFIKRL